MTFGLPEDDDEQRVPLAVGNSEQRHKKGKPRKFAGLSFWRSLQINRISGLFPLPEPAIRTACPPE